MSADDDTARAVPHRLDRALADVAKRLTRVTVQIRGPRGAMGSGVIWAAAGLVLTNAHVVRGPSAVVLSTGQRFTARLLARDPEADLAALSIGAGGLPAAEIGDARALRVGEMVIAVGHPLGVDGAVTTGVVHATPRIGRAACFIEADLLLLPGNSGGPLADARGRVVGINAMVAGGLALAVPEHRVARFLGALRDRMAAPA